MAIKPQLQFLGKIGLSLALLAILAHLVDWQEALSMVKTMNPWPVLLGVVLAMVVEGLNGFKVKLILRDSRATWWVTTQVNFLKTFFINILPGGATGEVVRVYYLGKTVKTHSKALVAVLMDRLTGLWVQSGMAVVSLAILSSGNLKMSLALLVALMFILGGAVASVIFFSKLLLLLQWSLERIGSKFKSSFKVNTAFQPYFEKVLKDKSLTLKILFAGFLYQTVINLNVMLLVQALGYRLNIFEVTVIMFINALVSALPISIGGWGVTEALFAFLFNSFGLQAEVGVVVSLLIRTVTLPSSLVGWVMFLKSGVSLKGLRPTSMPPQETVLNPK